MSSSVSVAGAVPTSALSSAGQDTSLLADPGIDSANQSGSSAGRTSVDETDEEVLEILQNIEGDDEYGSNEEVDRNRVVRALPVEHALLGAKDSDEVDSEKDDEIELNSASETSTMA